MKNRHSKLLKSSISYSSLIMILFLAVVGCEKNQPLSHKPLTGQVQIGIAGILQQKLRNTNESNSSTNSFARLSTSAPTEEKLSHFQNFSWALSAEDEPTTPLTDLSESSSRLTSEGFGFGSRSPMKIGNRYRILFYEIKNGVEKFYSSEEITVSKNQTEITLFENVTYNWYAYSYNDSRSIPLPADTEDPQIKTRTDAAFLYDKGTIHLSQQNKPTINVAFRHQIAKMEVKVNSLAIFANSISTIDARFVELPLSSKNFSLLSSSLSTQENYTVLVNEPISFIEDSSPAVIISSNELYSASGLAEMELLFSNINIYKSGKTLELIDPGDPVPAIITGFSADPLTKKRALINLKYKGGIIDDNEWSFGIIYFDPTDSFYPYKISDAIESGRIHSCYYYWNWNSKLPRTITNGHTPSPGDPCRELYPKNTWRTPSTAEFRALNIAYANKPQNGAVYFLADNGEKVYFHEAGWIKSSFCQPSNSNDGHYWSAESKNSKRGRSLQVDERGGSGAGNGLSDYPKDYGFTVKCNRDI